MVIRLKRPVYGQMKMLSASVPCNVGVQTLIHSLGRAENEGTEEMEQELRDRSGLEKKNLTGVV